MYSMAMIMVEVLTHESPFQEYLDYVGVDDLLQAIAGKININSQLPPVCTKSLLSSFLHPFLFYTITILSYGFIHTLGME